MTDLFMHTNGKSTLAKIWRVIVWPVAKSALSSCQSPNLHLLIWSTHPNIKLNSEESYWYSSLSQATVLEIVFFVSNSSVLSSGQWAEFYLWKRLLCTFNPTADICISSTRKLIWQLNLLYTDFSKNWKKKQWGVSIAKKSYTKRIYVLTNVFCSS